MAKYAVAILSCFDNENKIFVVEADSEINAMKNALVDFCGTEETKKSQEEWQQPWQTVEEIKNNCFDGEICISLPILIN